MTRWNVAAAFIGAVLLSGSAQAGNPIKGKQIYDGNCQTCHGINGAPRYPGAPNFLRRERMEFSDAMLINSLRTGKNLCPSWRSTLTELDMADVVTYIRTLGR